MSWKIIILLQTKLSVKNVKGKKERKREGEREAGETEVRMEGKRVGER